ncbi:centrosome-associated protein ALMS1 [Bombina bombina]|uniref:centrosome-associated protein ALMS1 n=1 Tax=Bombina bombina TaxID=8345 RepID=UPI00235ABDD7|nr:centrosome-associated protein ALMS1 [Bombina bombina]
MEESEQGEEGRVGDTGSCTPPPIATTPPVSQFGRLEELQSESSSPGTHISSTSGMSLGEAIRQAASQSMESWYQLPTEEDDSNLLPTFSEIGTFAEQTEFPTIEEGTIHLEPDRGKGASEIKSFSLNLEMQDSRLSPCLPLLTSGTAQRQKFFDDTLLQKTEMDFAPLRGSLDMSEFPSHHSLQISDAVALASKEVSLYTAEGTVTLSQHDNEDVDASSMYNISQHPLYVLNMDRGSADHGYHTTDVDIPGIPDSKELAVSSQEQVDKCFRQEDGLFLDSNVPAPLLLQLLEKEVGLSSSSGMSSRTSSSQSVTAKETESSDITQNIKPDLQQQTTTKHQLLQEVPSKADVNPLDEEYFKDSREIDFFNTDSYKELEEENIDPNQSGITVRSSIKQHNQVSKEVLHKQMCSEIQQRFKERKISNVSESQSKNSSNVRIDTSLVPEIYTESNSGKENTIIEAHSAISCDDLTISSRGSIERGHKDAGISPSDNPTVEDGSFIGRLAHPISQSTPGTFTVKGGKKHLTDKLLQIKAKLTGSDMSLNEEEPSNSSSQSNMAPSGKHQNLPSSHESYPDSSDSPRSLSPQRRRIQSLPSLNYIEKVGAWNTNQSFDALVLRGLTGVSPKKRAYNAVAESLNRILSSQRSSTTQKRGLAASFSGTSSMTNLNSKEKYTSSTSQITRSQSYNSVSTIIPETPPVTTQEAVDKPVKELNEMTVNADPGKTGECLMEDIEKSCNVPIAAVIDVCDSQRECSTDQSIQESKSTAEIDLKFKGEMDLANNASERTTDKSIPGVDVGPVSRMMDQFSDVSLDNDFLSSSHSSDQANQIFTNSAMAASIRSVMSLEIDNFVPFWSPSAKTPEIKEINIEERIPTYLRNLGIDQSPTTILTPFVPKGPIREPEFSPSELRTIKGSTATPTKSLQLSEGGSQAAVNISYSSIFSTASTTSVSIPMGSEHGHDSPLPTEPTPPLSPTSPKDRPVSQYDLTSHDDESNMQPLAIKKCDEQTVEIPVSEQLTEIRKGQLFTPDLHSEEENATEETYRVKQLIHRFEYGSQVVNQNNHSADGHDVEGRIDLSLRTGASMQKQTMDSINDSFVGSKTLKEIRKLLAEADDPGLDFSGGGFSLTSLKDSGELSQLWLKLSDSLKSDDIGSETASPIGGLVKATSWESLLNSSVRNNKLLESSSSKADLGWGDISVSNDKTGSFLEEVNGSKKQTTEPFLLQRHYGRFKPEGSSEATKDKIMPYNVQFQNNLSSKDNAVDLFRGPQNTSELLNNVTSAVGSLAQTLAKTTVATSTRRRDDLPESDDSSADSLAARVTSLLRNNAPLASAEQIIQNAEEEEKRRPGTYFSSASAVGGLQQALVQIDVAFTRQKKDLPESDDSSTDTLAARVTSLMRNNASLASSEQTVQNAEDEEKLEHGAVNPPLYTERDLSEEDRKRIEEIKRELLQGAREARGAKNQYDTSSGLKDLSQWKEREHVQHVSPSPIPDRSYDLRPLNLPKVSAEQHVPPTSDRVHSYRDRSEITTFKDVPPTSDRAHSYRDRSEIVTTFKDVPPTSDRAHSYQERSEIVTTFKDVPPTSDRAHSYQERSEIVTTFKDVPPTSDRAHSYQERSEIVTTFKDVPPTSDRAHSYQERSEIVTTFNDVPPTSDRAHSYQERSEIVTTFNDVPPTSDRVHSYQDRSGIVTTFKDVPPTSDRAHSYQERSEIVTTFNDVPPTSDRVHCYRDRSGIVTTFKDVPPTSDRAHSYQEGSEIVTTFKDVPPTSDRAHSYQEGSEIVTTFKDGYTLSPSLKQPEIISVSHYSEYKDRGGLHADNQVPFSLPISYEGTKPINSITFASRKYSSQLSLSPEPETESQENIPVDLQSMNIDKTSHNILVSTESAPLILKADNQPLVKFQDTPILQCVSKPAFQEKTPLLPACISTDYSLARQFFGQSFAVDQLSSSSIRKSVSLDDVNSGQVIKKSGEHTLAAFQQDKDRSNLSKVETSSVTCLGHDFNRHIKDRPISAVIEEKEKHDGGSQSSFIRAEPIRTSSPTRKALSCVHVTISPKLDSSRKLDFVIDKSVIGGISDHNEIAETIRIDGAETPRPRCTELLKKEQVLHSQDLLSYKGINSSSYFLHPPPETYRTAAQTSGEEDQRHQKEREDNVRKRTLLSDATTQITTESPSKTTFSAEIFINDAERDNKISTSSKLKSAETSDVQPLDRVQVAYLSRATDQPMLLPYRPPGSPELFYVPYIDKVSRLSPVRSSSTIESSHTGSNDAISPTFPAEVLGSATEKHSNFPVHKDGIYSKGVGPKIAWEDGMDDPKETDADNIEHTRTKVLSTPVQHGSQNQTEKTCTTYEPRKMPDYFTEGLMSYNQQKENEFFPLRPEVDYSREHYSHGKLSLISNMIEEKTEKSQRKKNENDNPISLRTIDITNKHQSLKNRDYVNNSSEVTDFRKGAPENVKSLRDISVTASNSKTADAIRKSQHKTSQNQNQSNLSSLDDLWARYTERKQNHLSDSNSKLELSLVERLDRLARLLQRSFAHSSFSEDVHVTQDQVLGRKEVTEGQWASEKMDEERWYQSKQSGLDDMKISEGPLRLKHSVDKTRDRLAYSDFSSELKSTETESVTTDVETATQTDSDSVAQTGVSSSISTIDTVRLIKAFGPERVQPSSRLSHLYSTIDNQKKRTEESMGKLRRHIVAKESSNREYAELKRSNRNTQAEHADTSSTVSSSWEPSPALIQKKKTRQSHKGVQAGDLEIVTSATKKNTRDVGTTFPSPCGEPQRSLMESSSRGHQHNEENTWASKFLGGRTERKSKRCLPQGMSWFVPADDLKSESRKENESSIDCGPGLAWHVPLIITKPLREPLREKNLQEYLTRRDKNQLGGSDGENKTLRPFVKVTLQESLKTHRPDFIFRSGERVKRLQLLAKERKLQTEFQSERDVLFNQVARRGVSNYTQKESRKVQKTRTVPKQEMIQRSKRIYQQLPEVRKKREDEKRQSEYELYRLKAQLFRKKVTNHILGRKTPWN